MNPLFSGGSFSGDSDSTEYFRIASEFSFLGLVFGESSRRLDPSHVCRSGPDGRSASSPRLLVASERTKESANAPVPKGTRAE